MQKAPVMLAIAAVCAGGIGIAIAATSHRSASPPASVSSPPPSPSIVASAPSQPEVTESPSTPKPEVVQPRLDDFPHQRLVFRDELTVYKSPFAQFRDQARRAIERRDVQFIKTVVPKKGIAIGFGRPQTLEQWNLDNPNAHLWSILEKAISGPCSLTNVKSEQDADGFVCSNAAGELEKQYPPPKGTEGVGHLIDKVIIVGKNVNVRSQPTTNSPIVAKLSNEVVKLDRKTFESEYGASKREYDPIKDWLPVILPNDKTGFVSSRYAHQPLEYRVIFAKIDGKWQLTEIPGGD
jgi:hypothetical protein